MRHSFVHGQPIQLHAPIFELPYNRVAFLSILNYGSIRTAVDGTPPRNASGLSSSRCTCGDSDSDLHCDRVPARGSAAVVLRACLHAHAGRVPQRRRQTVPSLLLFFFITFLFVCHSIFSAFSFSPFHVLLHVADEDRREAQEKEPSTAHGSVVFVCFFVCLMFSLVVCGSVLVVGGYRWRLPLVWILVFGLMVTFSD